MQTSKHTAGGLEEISDAAPDKAYSVKEAAQRIGVCARTLYNESKAGRIKLRKIGRRTIVPAPTLAAYIANLPLASA